MKSVAGKIIIVFIFIVLIFSTIGFMRNESKENELCSNNPQSIQVSNYTYQDYTLENGYCCAKVFAGYRDSENIFGAKTIRKDYDFGCFKLDVNEVTGE